MSVQEICDNDYKLELVELTGKVVERAVCGRNEGGYDILIITFTDKTSLEVLELGQCGEFTVHVRPKP